MKRISTSNRIMLRSMGVTLFILVCTAVAAVMMGEAYSALQKDAFGVEASAFSFSSKDYITLFGKEFYFPLISIFEKAVELWRRGSSGIIKLLGVVIETTKELGNVLFKG